MAFSARKELFSLLSNCVSEPFCGELEDNVLKMPYVVFGDSRRLTWTKLINRIELTNNPESINDCWFVKSNAKVGYPAVRLSKTGTRNKWKLCELLHILLFPSNYCYMNIKDPSGGYLVLAHRCGKSRIPMGKYVNSCINPYHTVLTDPKTKQDHKGCKYGAAFLCPHTPKCVFTDSKGTYCRFRNIENYRLESQHRN